MSRHPSLSMVLAVAVAISTFGFLDAGGASGASTSTTPKQPTTKRSTTRKPRRKGPLPSEVALSPALVSAPGAEVTMQPVGLSFEYPVMAQALGSGPCPPAALVAALTQLGSPPLSLAGDSQDMTAPGGALTSPAPNWELATSYSLPSGFWSQLHCLLSASRDPLTVGLDARDGQLSWAEAMVAGAQGAATNGLSFSIGNEPDLYALPNYASLDKPLPNEEAAAVGYYLQVAAYLEPALDGEPLIGPELARPAHWQASLPRVIGTLHDQTLGVHLYPLSACETQRAVTIGGLLSPQAAESPDKLAWVVSDATAAGVPTILSEANSASCGGVAGVSDSPAAAVWAVRFVLNALETGFREVRFHFSGDPYDPFLVRGNEVLPRPLDDALVALNQWLPVGSTLRSVPGRELVATAIGQAGGTPLLVLDNEQAKPRPVILRGAASAHIQLFSAASVGVKTETITATHGLIKLSIAPSSLDAISWTA